MAKEPIRKRILFVDDEAGIRLTLPRLFAKHGFDATSVANVEDALAEIAAEKFDALLSELNLARANDGFTVILSARGADTINLPDPWIAPQTTVKAKRSYAAPDSACG